MRKIIIMAMMLLSAPLCHAQNFFGLNFGEVYSTEQIKKAVGDLGVFEGSEDEGFAIGDAFSNVRYEGHQYEAVVFLKNANGGLLGVMFTLSDESGSAPGLNDEFMKVKETYEKKGDFIVDDSQEGSENFVMELETMYFVLNRRLDGRNTVQVTLGYLSPEGLVTMLNDIQETSLPEIQDEFFGIKMGKRITESSIKSALGTKGEFLKSESASSYKKYTFTDVVFAGHTWSYGTFDVTPDGRFFSLSVYDSLDDYSDERREAESTFSSFKRKLDDKYGEEEVEQYEDGSGKSVTYFGSNNMAVILSNTRSRSSGGSYRRYVKLEYIQVALYREIQNAANDEL